MIIKRAWQCLSVALASVVAEVQAASASSSSISPAAAKCLSDLCVTSDANTGHRYEVSLSGFLEKGAVAGGAFKHAGSTEKGQMGFLFISPEVVQNTNFSMQLASVMSKLASVVTQTSVVHVGVFVTDKSQRAEAEGLRVKTTNAPSSTLVVHGFELPDQLIALKVVTSAASMNDDTFAVVPTGVAGIEGQEVRNGFVAVYSKAGNSGEDLLKKYASSIASGGKPLSITLFTKPADVSSVQEVLPNLTALSSTKVAIILCSNGNIELQAFTAYGDALPLGARGWGLKTHQVTFWMAYSVPMLDYPFDSEKQLEEIQNMFSKSLKERQLGWEHVVHANVYVSKSADEEFLGLKLDSRIRSKNILTQIEPSKGVVSMDMIVVASLDCDDNCNGHGTCDTSRQRHIPAECACDIGWSGPSCEQAKPVSETIDVDVAIVGAGLAGSAAAWYLNKHAPEMNFVILETLDRASGRVQDMWLNGPRAHEVLTNTDDPTRLNTTTMPGTPSECGGAWLGPTHQCAPELVYDLGLELLDTFSDGNMLLRMPDGSQTKTDLPLSFNQDCLSNKLDAADGELGCLESIQLLDEVAAGINATHPWASKDAELLDSITSDEWMNSMKFHQEAKNQMAVLSFMFDHTRMSALWFLHHAKTLRGSIYKTLDTIGGFFHAHVKGGFGQVPKEINRKLGERTATNKAGKFVYDAKVSQVRWNTDGVSLITHSGVRVNAKQAIMAVGNYRDRAKIQFWPAPDEARVLFNWQLSQFHAQVRGLVVYDTAWWRDLGYSGWIIDFQGFGLPGANFDFAQSESNSPGVVMFHTDSEYIRGVDMGKFKQRVKEWFSVYFNSTKAFEINMDIVLYDWTEHGNKNQGYTKQFDTLYSRGAVEFSTPGMLTERPDGWREPLGGVVHFAGSAEAVMGTKGLGDGAIGAGRSAAKAVCGDCDIPAMCNFDWPEYIRSKKDNDKRAAEDLGADKGAGLQRDTVSCDVYTCKPGFFVSVTIAGECEPCPPNSDALRGAMSKDDCGCIATYYPPNPNDPSVCESCRPGCTCAGDFLMNADREYITKINSAGTSVKIPHGPILKKGYMGMNGLIYKCKQSNDCDGPSYCACPGGVAPEAEGQCGNNRRLGIACGQCDEDYHLSARTGECEKCSGANGGAAPYIFVIVAFLLSIFFWPAMNGRLDARVKPQAILGVNIVCTFVALQSLGVMSSFKVKWPSFVASIMQFGSEVGGDGFLFYPACVLPQTFKGHWLGNLIAPLVWTAFAILVFVVAMFIPLSERRRTMFGFSGTVNVIGTIWTCLYVTIVVRTVAFVQCYEHPEGGSSLERYPWVLCDSDEWEGILPWAIIFVLVYIVGILSGLLFITLLGPKKIPIDEYYWVKFRFVFLSYRPECFFWKFAHMVRCALCASVGAFAPNDAYLRLILMAFFSMIFGAGVFFCMPWYDASTNYLDISVLQVVAFISLIGMTKVDDFIPTESQITAYNNMLTVAMVLFWGLFVVNQVIVLKKLKDFGDDENAKKINKVAEYSKQITYAIESLNEAEYKHVLTFANDQDKMVFRHLAGFFRSMAGNGSRRVPRPPHSFYSDGKDKSRSKEVHV